MASRRVSPPGVSSSERSGDDESGTLERCLSEPGYTPPVRALSALLRALPEQEAEQQDALERALARAGVAVLEPTLTALAEVKAELRPRLLALLGRVAGEQLTTPTDDTARALRERLGQVLVASLDEPAPASQRWAARALAKLADPSAEPALLRALATAALPEARALVDALGALGGEASRQALDALGGADAELERRRQRALALIARRSSRQEPCAIVFDQALASPGHVRLSCRAGLEGLLREELAELGWDAAIVADPMGSGGCELDFGGTLAQLLGARLAQDVALCLPLDESLADPTERVAEALARPSTLRWLQSWSSGRPRFRVDWSDAGHQRARSWALAQSVQRRTATLLNDPERAPWTVRARSDGRGVVYLVPRLEPDPRFAYRQRDVRAASHPTIAAALARAGEVRADDVVWDPFVGSGLELVERARRGPFAELWGSDIDGGALDAARANLDAAGVVGARLLQRSALEFAPPGVSLILSNPPMGRRVARDGSLAELLGGFVRHAARALRPGGRLVWLSPLAAHTAQHARDSGLSVQDGPEVDLGGFSARLQICWQRSAPAG